ncbi:MAG: hypothetical protein AAF228_12770 [Pseudomonadota bacterium]
MSTPSADDMLEKVFDVILQEAKVNPEFSDKIENTFSKQKVQKTTRKPSAKTSSQKFDFAKYHAVNILRNSDEQTLRSRLNSITKDKLKKIALYSGLVLTGNAAKKTASKAEMIQGIVEAAQQYVAQRVSAKAK